MPPPEPTKEPFHREMALPEAHAHHVPRPPTRAFVNTAEPAKPAVKGSKIAEPPRTLHSDPGTCEPPDTIPSAPAHRKPDAHRAAEAMGRGQAGTHTPGLPPRHLRRDAYWHEISLRTNHHDSCQRHGKRLAAMKCAYRRLGAVDEPPWPGGWRAQIIHSRVVSVRGSISMAGLFSVLAPQDDGRRAGLAVVAVA
jgi:hypothetical protein